MKINHDSELFNRSCYQDPSAQQVLTAEIADSATVL